MKSKNINYNPIIDDTRAIACILVFLLHLEAAHFSIIKKYIPNFSNFAFIGVTLFFVLSGYLFTLISYKKEMSYKNFMVNRILRILPLYTCVMFISFSLNIKTLTGADLLNFFVPNGAWFYNAKETAITWTIGVEFSFYLIFPFLITGLNTKGVKYLLGIFVLVVTLNLCLLPINDFPVSYLSIFFRLPHFLIGMFAGVLVKNYGHKLHFPFSYLIAVFALLFLIFFPIGHLHLRLHYLYEMYFAVLCALFIIFNNKRLYLNWLGKISFSFYLLHTILLDAIAKLFIHHKNWLSWNTATVVVGIIAFIASIIIATLSYNLIEKPFLEKRRKYTK